MKEETSHIIGYKTLDELIKSLIRLKTEIIEYEVHSTKSSIRDFNILENSVLGKYIIIDNRGRIWDRTRVGKKRINGIYKSDYIAYPESLLLHEPNLVICNNTMPFDILNELGIDITEEDKRIIESQYESIDHLRFLYGELHPLMVWHKDLITRLIMLHETFKELNKMVSLENRIKLDKPIIKKLLEFREQLFMYLDSIDFLKSILTIIFREYSQSKIIDDKIILAGESALINLTTKDYLAFSDCQLWSEGTSYNPSYKALIHYGDMSVKELKLDDKFLENIIDIFNIIYYKAMPMDKTYYSKVFRELNGLQYFEILSAFIQFERIIKNENFLRFTRNLYY